MSDLELNELRASFDRLRGRLFQVVESVGMPQRQEEAAKGVIRTVTYDMQRSIEQGARDVRRTD